MNNLSNNVYDYYCSRFAELPLDKQLHFASRLFLWSGDEFGRQKLTKLRGTVTANDDPQAALKTVYQDALKTIHHGSKNAAELRAPYFEKYPRLRPLAMVLFRLTFLESIYRVDGRETFFELFSKTEVEKLLTDLLADAEALSILSTHAINVLYLYYRVVLDDGNAFDPALFLRIGAEQYNLDNPIHLQLYIYLYTHCIIGESQFYARPVPAQHLAIYRQMLDELETVIAQRFSEVNLDNKFEFLVCCKLVGKLSALEQRIMAEAEQSVSPDGDFLVDRHNTNPQTANSTFDLSEHRNVLFILANLPHQPGAGQA